MTIRGSYQFDRVEGLRVGRINRGINTTFICYRIGDTLFDSGPANQWLDVKPFVDKQPVRQLLLTHHHEDHSGNAARIAERCNLIPQAPPQCRNKLTHGYRVPPLQRLFWGGPQPVQTRDFDSKLVLDDGSPIVPVHTPGHAPDLTCFFLPRQGWLFSGDLYIARTIRQFRIDESLPQFVDSIRKVLALEFETLLCPHRGVVEGGRAALQAKLDNILELCSNAQALHQQGTALEQIVTKLLGKEEMIALLTGYNFSKRNLVRQALLVDTRESTRSLAG